MEALECLQCGGKIELSNDGLSGKCIYCGTQYKYKAEKKTEMVALLNQANVYRRKNDFDGAIVAYEQALTIDAHDADVYWGLVLCRFGIEYVLDPRTDLYIPTCRRTIKHSIFDDKDFKNALMYASDEQKMEYKKQALEIDRLQNAIKEKIKNEKDYEVFLSFKATDSEGNPTKDKYIARRIYDELTRRNIKTFFSEETLKNKLGSDFEPIIYKALYTSKVIILITTNMEYVISPWVKNEWTRFRDRMKDEHLSNAAISVFENIDPSELPPIFRAQGIDLRKYPAGGYEVDLADNLEIILGIRKKHSELDQSKLEDLINEKLSSNQSNLSNVSSLLKRAQIELKDGMFDKAHELYDEVLKIDPECSESWWGLLLVKFKCRNSEELKNYSADLTQYREYNNAIEFATMKEKQEYQSYKNKTKYNLRMKKDAENKRKRQEEEEKNRKLQEELAKERRKEIFKNKNQAAHNQAKEIINNRMNRRAYLALIYVILCYGSIFYFYHNESTLLSILIGTIEVFLYFVLFLNVRATTSRIKRVVPIIAVVLGLSFSAWTILNIVDYIPKLAEYKIYLEDNNQNLSNYDLVVQETRLVLIGLTVLYYGFLLILSKIVSRGSFIIMPFVASIGYLMTLRFIQNGFLSDFEENIPYETTTVLNFILATIITSLICLFYMVVMSIINKYISKGKPYSYNKLNKLRMKILQKLPNQCVVCNHILEGDISGNCPNCGTLY